MAPDQVGGVDPLAVGRYWVVARRVVRPGLQFLIRTHLDGAENIPAAGPAIFAPNHISFIDSTLLMFLLPRRITFVGKAEYMDSWKTRHLFPAMGMIPIDRKGGKSSSAALDAAASVLDRGEFFGIYPEGTRSRTGDLHKGHTGVARLALRTGAPIIPTGIIGTEHIQPPDAPMIKPFRPATLRFGKPIDPARYGGRDDDRLVYRQLTDEVMFEIRSLTGQTYVDRYASRSAAEATAPADEARIESRPSPEPPPVLARA